jgi:hypothetical protein
MDDFDFDIGELVAACVAIVQGMRLLHHGTMRLSQILETRMMSRRALAELEQQFNTEIQDG